jgi:hypothetical protein
MKYSCPQPHDDDYRAAVESELSHGLQPGGRFFQPTVKVIFKDLTYETITDEKFRGATEEVIPRAEPAGFFEEHDSAPELRLAGKQPETCELRQGPGTSQCSL